MNNYMYRKKFKILIFKTYPEINEEDNFRFPLDILDPLK